MPATGSHCYLLSSNETTYYSLHAHVIKFDRVIEVALAMLKSNSSHKLPNQNLHVHLRELTN